MIMYVWIGFKTWKVGNRQKPGGGQWIGFVGESVFSGNHGYDE